MAERYSGKFSPKPGPRPFDGQRRSRIGAKANLLLLAPVPLVFKAFAADPVAMAGYLAAFVTLEAGAYMTREGLRAQEAYEAKRIARRPALPRKLIGTVLIAGGLALAGLAGHGVLAAVLFALIGGALHVAAFGIDPLRAKGLDGMDEFQVDRVARAVEGAEAHLAAMREAAARTGDRALITRVEGFIGTARGLFRSIEDDPRDLTAARRYLGVYLKGARDATQRLADLRGRDPGARDDYMHLLDDLQGDFAARTQKLLSDDRQNLDIEISVLRDRLAREGVKTE